MVGAIRIPNTVGELVLTMDLRAGRITCQVDVEAPKDGRPATRVNWLVRQLRDAPENVRVEAFSPYARGGGTAELLRDVRPNPLILVPDAAKEIRTFRVALATPLGAKRGRGRGGAIDSVLDAADAFYTDVLGRLKAWTAAPPKLREERHEQPAVDDQLVSTSLSSQDGAMRTDSGNDSLSPLPESQAPVESESDQGEDGPASVGRDEQDDVPPAWLSERKGPSVQEDGDATDPIDPGADLAPESGSSAPATADPSTP